MNGAIFDPANHQLVVSAKIADIGIMPPDGDEVTIVIDRLLEGIEIVHDDDRIWRPVE